MIDKNKLIGTSSFNNYTYRSGKFEYVSDEELLKLAKSMGITIFGFTDIVPNPDLILPDENNRMIFSEMSEYIESINKLKLENQDMTVLIGFKAEFDPMKESYLEEIREKVDYMILDQRFITRDFKSDNNPNFPIEYANMVTKAIESGIFDIVSYPDFFMKYRDTIKTDEDKKIFDENAILASYIICEKARDMKIPIEINLLPTLENQLSVDGSLLHPNFTFWNIAKEVEGLKVLNSIDIHYLHKIEETEIKNSEFINIEKMLSDKIVSNLYNPKLSRMYNSKLKDAYNTHKENVLTFQTHIITKILSRSLMNIEEELDKDSLTNLIKDSLNAAMSRYEKEAKSKIDIIMKEIPKILNEPEMPFKIKKNKLEKQQRSIKETNKVLLNQKRIIEIANNACSLATSIGCENKHEYFNIIAQMLQHETSKNENQKSKIMENVANFSMRKAEYHQNKTK